MIAAVAASVFLFLLTVPQLCIAYLVTGRARGLSFRQWVMS